MYEILDKDTIKSEILPYLSVAKRGYVTKSDLFVHQPPTLPQKIDSRGGLF